MVFVCVDSVHCDNQEVSASLGFAYFASSTEKYKKNVKKKEKRKRSQRRERAQR